MVYCDKTKLGKFPGENTLIDKNSNLIQVIGDKR